MFPRSFSVMVPAALAVAFAFSGGCALKDKSSLASDTTGAEDVNGTESDVAALGTTLVASNGQSVTASSIGGSGETLKVEDNGTTADDVGAAFQPAGCFTATVDASAMTATYVFDACTGPLGLVELDGTIDVTWSQAAGGPLTVNYAAQGFHINRATVDSWTAQAVVTATGNARHLVWTAKLSGTTHSGRTFSRTNDKVIDWTVGQACVTVSGTSDGTITGAELQTTIVSYSRCAAECPQAGSEITVKNVKNGDSIDIKYDGGPEAVLTVDGKSSYDIGLACGL
ncbi:MAG TPA: hypothetical protein VHV30_03380 [Polyangiaceae bacterium]|jgi:hypothetical protein|nr:hypothetical protein [Polyangiaceae bacterium]